MKRYFVDTNVFLRYLLRDNEDQFRRAKKYFEMAENNEIEIILVPEILFEIEYVLRGRVYKLSRKNVASLLENIFTTLKLTIEQFTVLTDIVGKYKGSNVSLVDLYIVCRAIHEGGDVLSFDSDIPKIRKMYGV